MEVSDAVRKLFKMSPRPKFGTFSEWQEWELKSRKENPLVYWLLTTGFGTIEDIVRLPYSTLDSLRVYMKNRFFDKTHLLETRLKKGIYHEVDTRMLHGCFEALVDFVEVETAALYLWCNREEAGKYWRYRFKLLRFKSIRSRELGLKYLYEKPVDSEGVLGETYQQEQEKIASLYLWWKDTRPTRKDPYEEDSLHFDLETSYYEEDTEKLKQLISIRNRLWT
jgi:hypothetical protein